MTTGRGPGVTETSRTPLTSSAPAATAAASNASHAAGWPTAKRPVDARQQRERDGRGLGFLGRTALVIRDEPVQDVGPRIEQGVVEAEALRLGHAPRVHVLAPDPVLVLERALQHEHALPGPGENGGKGSPGDACSDHDDIGLLHHAPCVLGGRSTAVVVASGAT